jgi:hypothetical protein
MTTSNVAGVPLRASLGAEVELGGRDDLYEYEYAYDENGVLKRIAVRAINRDGSVTELPLS